LTNEIADKLGLATRSTVGGSTRFFCSRHHDKEHTLNPLSPREVQHRVRAGESPEFVAQETGWELARVIRYAEPPVRERAYVAQCASEVQLHQSRGSATLASVVGNSLGLKPEELTWDSAYIGGQWLVHIQSVAGTENAQWSYEPSGKSVNPLNPTARTLMGLEPARETLSPSASESTIIVDTSSAHLRAQRQSVNHEVQSAPVKLTAVPELFSIEEPERVVPHEVTTAPAAQTPVKKARKGRAKVPSWDEILFGATSKED